MIRKATQFDLEAVTMLAMRLWPEQARAELEPEFATLLDGDEAAVFLLFADGKAAGFAHCQLCLLYTSMPPVALSLPSVCAKPSLSFIRSGDAVRASSAFIFPSDVLPM